MITRTAVRACITVCLLLLSACTSIQQIVDMQKPDARVSGVALSSLSLTDVTLLVDVVLSNPNPMTLKAADFDLNLLIDGHRLASLSEPDTQVAVPARGTQTVQFPLTFTFREVAAALGGIKGRNMLDYAVEGKVRVDMPVLGEVNIPVSFSDVLPVPQLPVIRFRAISLDSIDWSGAQLKLDLEVSNPNAFAVDLKRFAYHLNASGREISQGDLSPLALPQGDTREVSVPLSVNLTSLGISLFRLLSGGDSVEVNLTGSADVLPDLELWQPEPLTFEAVQTLNP